MAGSSARSKSWSKAASLSALDRPSICADIKRLTYSDFLPVDGEVDRVEVGPLATFVVVYLQDLAAFELGAQRARNVVVGLVHVGEAGVAAAGRQLHRIEQRRPVRFRVIAGVVMKPHLPVAKGADRLAV